jgi:hypothetical protein
MCTPDGTAIGTDSLCAPSPAWLTRENQVPTGCQDVDDCAARPCANGGTCTDRGQETQLPTDAGTFTCACATGWVGDTCKEDIDECADKTHTCDPNADCINTPGAFDCICRIFEVAEPEFSGPGRMSGWEGPGFNPETEDGPPGCTDIPDCERFTPCQNGGTCAEGVQGSGQYACTCTYGWTNANCDIDENECENGVEDCHENAFCTNTDGSWACTCNDCYTGDGRYCFDADDCEFSPCANGGTCTDVGSCAFECDCLIGWRGKTCEDDWNECTMGIHTCHDDAICINNDGSFSCKCDTGFSGDGYRVCNDIDDCVYYQEAKPNFPIIGSNVCLHGVGGDGCVDAGPNIFICTCIKGWVDANCDMNDNECQNGRGEEEGQNRCHKYATCTNTEGSYTCRCNHGYTGDGTICTDISDCNGDTCGHGQCTDTGVGSFRCTCDEGWTDKTCSFNIDECSALTHECHDDATCDDGDGSYTCTCNIGYTGDGRGDCTDVDDCGSAPCEHGTCYDKGPAVYGCKCDQGWRDYNCDFDVNECYLGTHNCHIEGRCVNTPGGFYCRCLSGMEGDGYQTSHVHNGATAVDMFMERQCENEGGRIVTCKFKEQNSYDKVAKKKPELVDGLTFLGFYLNTEHQYRDHVGKSELIGTNAIGCVDLDDCDPARDGKGPPDDPCSPDYGDCKDMGRNKYYCECVRGWGGLDCMMDCNECEDGAGDPKCPGHTCTPNTATCENSAGSYMCMCQQDFWGTAYDDDVHNRIFPVYPGGCNPCTTCGVGYKVIRPCMQMEPEESKGKPNLDGTYRICGYQDGCGPERGAEPAFKNSHTQDSLCGDIDECADNLDNCDPRAKCINTVGSFTCTCMIDLQFWGDGITCQPCTTCGPGYKEEQDCTSLTDRICRLDLDDGLFLIQSQADDTPQCLMFDGEMKSYYPERYNWGYSDVLCGAIPSPLCSYTDKRWCQLMKLVEQREAVFRLTHITRDFYTIENNADGAGWRCLGFSHEGDWAYPELMTWGLPGDPLCGFAAANGATPEENLLVNGQAVWKLIPLNRHLTKFSLMIDATANDKADWACIFFDNGGQATNPSRAPTARSNGKWGHGGDFCGISCIAPECTDPIAKLLKNKQAVWILTPLCKKAKKANEKGANPEIIFDECPLDTEETGEEVAR